MSEISVDIESKRPVIAANLEELRYLVFYGMTGDDGKSAYELAVELGFEGTEQEWLDSLQGADGKNYGIVVDGSVDHILELKSEEAIGAVKSVNGKTGAVTITAQELGALTEHQDISGKADTADVNAALAQKQNALTAGQNVTINGSIISAEVDTATIASNVTSWLNTNVNPVGSAVVVDASLSVSGAAADAKVTGEKIGDLKDDLSELNQDVYGEQVVITYVPNEYVANGGAFTQYNNWSRTNFIPIPNDGDGMRYTNDGRATAYCAWYSDKSESSFISMFPVQNTQTGNVPFPEGAKYFVVSNFTTDIEMFNYINPPIYDNGLVASVEDINERVTELESSQGSVPEIILPPYAVAVVGHEFNMYTENVVICDNLNSYIWVWRMLPYATQYNQYDDRFSVIPATGSERTYTLSLTCVDKITGTTLTSTSMSLIVVSDSVITGKKMLMIGDSLTAAGYSAYEIQSVLSENGVESLGTLSARPWIGNVQKRVNMEGRGGWGAYDYMHTASKNGNTNPFLNPSTNLFDFSYYMTQQGYNDVDIVMLNLGTNGTEDIQRDVEAMGQIIASIHSYNANIPVVVHLIPPPATQNGWTYINHGAGAEEFRLKTLAMVKAQIEAFGNKQSEKTYISCVYGCLDRYHDFAYQEVAVSQRNPFQVIMQVNNVHPSAYGYYKFADVYWGMIEYLLAT